MRIAPQIAGIGFRAGASLAAVRDALALVGASDVTHLALPERKRADPLWAALQAAGFTLIPISDAALANTETPSDSAIARKHYATGSVAEASALAAHPAARLMGTRAISGDRMATAALAQIKDTA